MRARKLELRIIGYVVPAPGPVVSGEPYTRPNLAFRMKDQRVALMNLHVCVNVPIALIYLNLLRRNKLKSQLSLLLMV